MTGYIIAAAAAEAILILFLLQKYFSLKAKCVENAGKESEKVMVSYENETEPPAEKVETLSSMDRIVKMHNEGHDADRISEELKIAKSKVNMTLKIEKIKKDAAEQLVE